MSRAQSQNLQQNLINLLSYNPNEVIRWFPYILQLSFHPYGNFFVQALIQQWDVCHIAICVAFQGHVKQLMKDLHGSRTIQVAFTHISDEYVHVLLLETFEDIMDIAFNTYGSRSLTCAYNRMHYAYLLRPLWEHIVCVSTHQHASLILQNVFKSTPHKHEIIQSIQKLSTDQLIHIASNAYGNYLIQDVVRCIEPTHKITQTLMTHFWQLARQQSGSNVAERLIEFATTSNLKKLLVMSQTFRTQRDERDFVKYVIRSLDTRSQRLCIAV